MSIPYSRIENVFAAPLRVRDRGLLAEYSDRVLQDGQMYKRVSEDVIPELCDALATHMGRPITLHAMGWRLNYADELPNKAIHSDSGWGRYAAVVCMDPNAPLASGTAFWKHLATGATEATIDDAATYFAMINDWDNPAKFEQVAMAQAQFNTAVVYDSSKLHSRWPFEAYGNSPTTGRLSIVAFFD